MSRELLVQKAIGFSLTGLAVAFLSPLQVVITFIVLGQGHFLAAYFYQGKAGKIDWQWIFRFAVIGIPLFVIAIISKDLEWFMLSAGVLFFFHHFHDETTLFRKERSVFRLLEQSLPSILYSALTSDMLLATELFVPACILSSIMLVIYGSLAYHRAYRPDILSVYLIGIAGILALLVTLGVSIPPEKLLGSVILFHYICWYVYFYYRFAADSVKQTTYIQEMLAIHALVFALYALFIYMPWGAFLLGFVFAPLYFYIWAILHILFSYRLADLKALLKW